ncbi:ABC transporter ATP-binding protein [Actinomycetospora lemnae]|uniref:ABC transporter ATP-binding protein n=1 Tax=Actinomycetospora lemnae TaxID=3019891 RepID=A0ABT5SNF4_9PSEU|nr:ABC transporter ATP-binding protein [Actinomycetospora sp. DW7H6]MDD7964357.1 ABC transporter ATP-binding protein [Actinomycetospora sp. DW7H6]
MGDSAGDSAGDGAENGAGNRGHRPLIGADELETPTWAVGLEASAKAGVGAVARSVPRTVAVLVRWAWRASRGWTLLAGVVHLVSGVVAAFGLLATADVFTRLLAEGPTPDRVLAALPALAVVAGALVVGGLLDAATGAVTAELVPRIERRAQTELYGALVQVDLVAFDDADFTALLERAEHALARIRRGAETVGDLISGLVSVTAAVAAAGVVHPVLAPVVLLAGLPQAWAAVSGVRLMFASVLRTTSQARRLAVVGDLIAGREEAAEVRAFTVGDVLAVEHERLATELAREGIRVEQRRNLLVGVGRGASGVATAAGYVAVGLLLYTGGLALPLAGTAVVAMRSARTAVVTTVYGANMLFEAGLFVELYTRCLAEARSRRRRGGGPPPGPPETVELDAVTFRYPDQAEPALTDVTLTLRRGEVVALVGENGSGKSTLAKLMVGLYLPDAGHVRWNGRDLRESDAAAALEHVALVAQDPVRWPVRADDNVRIGRLERVDPEQRAYVDAVARSGAADVLADLPRGAATVLSRAFQGGRDLSGGQWQRMAVARGLYRDAPLVVADEPTAALDARAEHAVFASLRELSAGGDRITVLVTHRLANVRTADRIVVLEGGRITAQGTHDELMAAGGLYRELFALQGRAYADVEDRAAG